MKKYVIAIDQGTTSSRVVVVDRHGDIIYKEQMEVQPIYVDDAVYQNADILLESVELLLKRVFSRYQINPKDVQAIGITNQRETTVLWNKKTGKPIDYAISWQSKQTKDITDAWDELGYGEVILDKTGLKISPYFSASKIKFLLERNKVNSEDVMFGTIDSFLLYHLSKEKNHYTDVTNASRTMLYNIHTLNWDQTLLELFGIPNVILPKVVANDTLFGHYQYMNVDIPIYGMIGDQQAALLGHQCFKLGEVKNTYGTGCFMLMNTGSKVYHSKNGLLSTIAWQIDSQVTYALEGSVFMGGASVQWIRDQLSIVKEAAETEKLANQSKDDTLYVVPAFVGLGTPYWDNDVKGSMLGLKTNTTKADIAKATLNAIAYQVTDVLNVMQKETGILCQMIAVDGGAAQNRYLLQFQADVMQRKVIQSGELEITALGAAYLAGVASGFWPDFKTISRNKKIKEVFHPMMKPSKSEKLYEGWQLAVKATQMFKLK